MTIEVPHLVENFMRQLIDQNHHSVGSALTALAEMNLLDMELDLTPQELKTETFGRLLIENFRRFVMDIDDTDYNTEAEMNEADPSFELFSDAYVKEHVEELYVHHSAAARQISTDSRTYFDLEARIAPEGRDEPERFNVVVRYGFEKFSGWRCLETMTVTYNPDDEAVLTKLMLSLS